MSCKGILLTNRKVDVQREGGNIKSHSAQNDAGKNRDFANAKDAKTSVTEVRMSNQDVGQSSCNDNVSTFMPEFISTNFALPSHSEITSDMGNLMNVDDWFKQRTESVSGMDLYAIKNDAIDAGYLGDSIGCIDSNNFLSTKDTVDMCLVTNICDMALGLDLPNISACERTFECINEKDCNSDTSILNDYQEQESLLLSLTDGDLLGKDSVLVGDTKMGNTEEDKSLTRCKTSIQPCTTSSVLISNDEHYILSDNHAILTKSAEKEVDESNWIDNLEMPSDSQSLSAAIDREKDKSNWDSLSIHTQRSSGAFDSEKDFPEFNFLTLQTDPTDGIMNSDLPHIDLLDDGDMTETEDENMEMERNTSSEHIIIDSLNSRLSDNANPLPTFPSKIRKEASNCRSTLPTIFNAGLNGLMNKHSTTNTSSQSLLKRNLLPQKVKSTLQPLYQTPVSREKNKTKLPSTATTNSKARLDTTKMVRPTTPSGPMAIIAISTDKSKNTTQIVINTPQGEQQIYTGKTSEFMKAPPYVQVKSMDKLLAAKRNKALTNGNKREPMKFKMDKKTALLKTLDSTKHLSSADDFSSSELGTIFANELSDIDEFVEDDKNIDGPIMEALAEEGITEENFFRASISNGRKLWICPLSDCGILYPRLSLLKVHILSHYGRRPYRCDFQGCQWSFYKYFKLKRHKETHQKKKNWDCPIAGCGRLFTTVYNLKTHIKLHNRPAEMICPVETCKAKFQTKRKLEVHMKNHDSEYAPYKCVFKGCGKHYYSSNSLNSHIRSHQHKEEELRCQFCEKLFDKPCRLRFHLRTHTGDKPFSCSYEGCGWAFTSSSKLKRHMYKHTNERKFTCEIESCGKSFMRSEHLKEHSLTHIHARIFACPVNDCKVRFQARSSLYVHLKKHRERNISEQEAKLLVVCPVETCGQRYSCKSSLKQHMLKFHDMLAEPGKTQMDYIALLMGDDDDFATVESFQLSTDKMRVEKSNGETSGANTSQLEIARTSANHTGTLSVCTSKADNTCTSFQSKLASGKVAVGDELSSVVVTPPDKQNISSDYCQTVSELPVSKLCVNSSPATQRAISEAETVVPKSGGQGSARTRYTFEDVLHLRAKKTVGQESNVPAAVMPDMTLETGLLGGQDITHSFLLQDDLPDNHLLYQDDHMLAVSSTVGEYQIFLLDGSQEIHHEFAESTINLRDLE